MKADAALVITVRSVTNCTVCAHPIRRGAEAFTQAERTLCTACACLQLSSAARQAAYEAQARERALVWQRLGRDRQAMVETISCYRSNGDLFCSSCGLRIPAGLVAFEAAGERACPACSDAVFGQDACLDALQALIKRQRAQRRARSV